VVLVHGAFADASSWNGPAADLAFSEASGPLSQPQVVTDVILEALAAVAAPSMVA
jgi:hypothetical protein